MSEALSTDQKKLPARERILQTAHDLFYQDGIRATGIDRVIADAGVTKVTFYRHFPSKNDLVRAFMEERHGRWMNWFMDALRRHGAYSGQSIMALVPVLGEWFRNETYRGCAFINTVVELGQVLPEAVGIARRHKREMTRVISDLLPASSHAELDAEAIAMAVDGAIIRAQFDEAPDAALEALSALLQAVQLHKRI